MKSKPNILLASVDCLRGDAVYSRTPATPFLDNLASEGTVFRRMFSTGAWTAPAFIGTMTGKQPRSYASDMSIHNYPETLAERLQEAGYRTVATLDANYWISARQGFDRGFDEFHNFVDADSFETTKQNQREDSNEFASRLPDLVVDRFPGAIDTAWNAFRNSPLFGATRRFDCLLGANKSGVGATALADRFVNEVFACDEPFFGWIHFMDVHHPYLPQRTSTGDILRYPGPLVNYVNNTSVRPGIQLGDSGGKYLRKLYNQKVSEIDGHLKQLIQTIRQSSDRDVVVIVLGDHGEEFNEHGRYNHHNKPYNELLHVPCIVHGLGSSTVKRSTSLIDLKAGCKSVLNDGRFSAEFDSEYIFCRYINHGADIAGRTEQALAGREVPAQFRIAIDDDLKIFYDSDDDLFELYNIEDDFYEQQDIFSSADHHGTIRTVLNDYVREQQELSDQSLIREIDD